MWWLLELLGVAHAAGLDPDDPTRVMLDPLYRAALDELARAGRGGGLVEVAELAEQLAEHLLPRLVREQPAPPRLVDAPGAADILGITEDAFRSRLQRGQIPRAAVVRTGRRLQFRPDRLVRER